MADDRILSMYATSGAEEKLAFLGTFYDPGNWSALDARRDWYGELLELAGELLAENEVLRSKIKEEN